MLSRFQRTVSKSWLAGRWGGFAAFMLMVVAALVLLVYGAVAFFSKRPSANRPGTQGQGNPRVLVTISPATTYLTEPLRKDGYVDYVAALNDRGRQGVTLQNNAAVLLWQALGPGNIDTNRWSDYCRMLGIPPLPADGNYFVPVRTYARRPPEEGSAADEQAVNARVNQYDLQLTEAMMRPWSKKEFPGLADWLADNEKPLALVVEASRRPRYYEPLISGSKEMLIAVFSPMMNAHRNISTALQARAMLRFQEGKTEEAWEDLLSCHRLARLIGQGPIQVDSLVAVIVNGRACYADLGLLEHVQLPAARLVKMRADLERLAPMPRWSEKIDVAGRFAFLDIVACAARGEIDSLADLLRRPQSSIRPLQLLHDHFARAGIEWDVVLQMGNHWFDRIVAACRKPTLAERASALAQSDQELKGFAQAAKNRNFLGFSWGSGSSLSPSERFAGELLCLLASDMAVIFKSEDRATMYMDLVRLAFALAAYRADHGVYPATLAELAPKYIADIPEDLFTGGDLHYQRKDAGYLLYSVGPNGADDGGKTHEECEDGEECDDLVVRIPKPVAKKQ